MARKVFISYKYKDLSVADLNRKKLTVVDGQFKYVFRETIVRDYVDELQKKIGQDNINLGEKDGESLSEFSDKYIETSLKNKIRQSSITIILISKGMKTIDPENEQWIPWEISYSLRTVPTGNNTKQMNALFGVVLPDETGSYEWYFKYNSDCDCTTHYTGKLFKILRDNTFNILDKKFRECNGSNIYVNEEPSFIKTVKWIDFMYLDKYNDYIETAIKIKDNKEAYDVHINLD